MQHPDITRVERFGYLDEPEETEARCPVCGKVCDTFYMKDFEVLGCDVCIRAVDAWDE